MSKGLFINAATWLEPHFPNRAMAVLLRAADKKEIQHSFVRHRLAALPSEQVDELHEKVSSAISYTLARLSRAADSRNAEPAAWVENRLGVLP